MRRVIKILAVAIITVGLAVPAMAGSTSSGSPGTSSKKPRAQVERCAEARKAITFYRAARISWDRKREAKPPRSFEKPRSCARARVLAAQARENAQQARALYKAWVEYHYDWPSWLPSNWQALGACETGYGKRPGDWTWDSGTYVSAFGIYRPGYRDDAHRIGNLSWDETKKQLGRYPTPREQYEAGLSHLRTHGDGWGCPGP